MQLDGHVAVNTEPPPGQRPYPKDTEAHPAIRGGVRNATLGNHDETPKALKEPGKLYGHVAENTGTPEHSSDAQFTRDGAATLEHWTPGPEPSATDSTLKALPCVQLDGHDAARTLKALPCVQLDGREAPAQAELAARGDGRTNKGKGKGKGKQTKVGDPFP